MIKFIPFLYPNDSPLTVSPAFQYNHMNVATCYKLNLLYGEKFCPSHPLFENEISVELGRGEKYMKAEKYCCEEFKKKLDLLTENEIPGEWVENDTNKSIG